MGRRKGFAKDPHLHINKYLRILFRIFFSCGELHSNSKNPEELCDRCDKEVQELCAFIFDTVSSKGIIEWERERRVLRLNKRGISIRDIAKEVSLSQRNVSEIIIAIRRTKMYKIPRKRGRKKKQ